MPELKPDPLDFTSHAFFTRLCALPFVEAVYLYGSRARGDGDEWSDVDLAISCPAATAGEWLEVMHIAQDADILVEVQCVRLDTVRSEGFKAQIEKYKKRLYKRDG